MTGLGLAVTEQTENGDGQKIGSIQPQQNLEQEKKRIEERLKGYRQQLANPERQKVSMGDTAIDGGAILDVQLQNSVTTDQLALSQVNMALENAKNGTYGICDDCGEPIPQCRLDVKPDACCCLECQTARED